MVTILFLALGTVVLIVASGIKHTSRVHSAVAKHVSKSHVSQAVSALLITVQLSELSRVIEHVSIVNVTASVFLLAVILATKSGTDGELH